MIQTKRGGREAMDHPLIGKRVRVERHGELEIDEQISDWKTFDQQNQVNTIFLGVGLSKELTRAKRWPPLQRDASGPCKVDQNIVGSDILRRGVKVRPILMPNRIARSPDERQDGHGGEQVPLEARISHESGLHTSRPFAYAHLEHLVDRIDDFAQSLIRRVVHTLTQEWKDAKRHAVERDLALHPRTVIRSVPGHFSTREIAKDLEFADTLSIFGNQSNENTTSVLSPASITVRRFLSISKRRRRVRISLIKTIRECVVD